MSQGVGLASCLPKTAWPPTLKNDTKSQNQWAKNRQNTSIEEPGINESGIEAKKKGF